MTPQFLAQGATVALPAAVALVTGTVAAALSGWFRRLSDRESVWTSAPVLATLAACGGVGAALVARAPIELVTFAALAVGCAGLAAIDLACHRLPDAVLFPTALVLLTGLVLATVVTGSWSQMAGALGGAAALGLGFLILALLTPSGIGLGDVKLAAVLGLFLGWFGWTAVLGGVVFAFVFGGIAALGLVLARRAIGSTAVAFGPWLIVGACAAVGWLGG